MTSAVFACPETYAPDEVYNLAGQSSVGLFEQPADSTVQLDVVGGYSIYPQADPFL
jgi:GDP-D-mannose dehydratase